MTLVEERQQVKAYAGKLVYNDSTHSYWLGGRRVKSASKVAGIAADSFSVEQWRSRMCVIGMTLDPKLAERVAVDLDNKEAVQKVAEDAMTAAKADSRANRGTQRHRVLELGLLGQQDQFITEQQVADWKVLERTLDAYGLEPILDRVEQFVAWPDNGVVGRYDAYLKYRGMSALFDLKGGPNAVKYPHSTAVQLWLYRFAPWTSKTIIRDGDKSEVTEWTTAPDDADDAFAYVIYCDDHHDVGELWSIDLEAARRGGESALQIVDWRKSRNYGKDLAHQVASPKPIEPTPLIDLARRQALLARYQAMSDPEKLAFTALKIDPNNLDAVEAGLDQVDRFNVTCDPPPLLKAVPHDPPTPPDEGDPVELADVLALSTRYENLSPQAKAWTGALVSEGNRVWTFRIRDRPTVRRYELYRGILTLAEMFWGEGK